MTRGWAASEFLMRVKIQHDAQWSILTRRQFFDARVTNVKTLFVSFICFLLLQLLFLFVLLSSGFPLFLAFSSLSHLSFSSNFLVLSLVILSWVHSSSLCCPADLTLLPLTHMTRGPFHPASLTFSRHMLGAVSPAIPIPLASFEQLHRQIRPPSFCFLLC